MMSLYTLISFGGGIIIVQLSYMTMVIMDIRKEMKQINTTLIEILKYGK